MKSVTIAAVVAIIAMLLFSCSGKRPSNLRVTDGAFAPCPSSPNCISSDASDSGHQVAPFQLAVAPRDAWLVALDLVSGLPRTHIVTETDDYLHAECRSAVFGFVDDLELHFRPTDGIIAVRSASRLGYSDIGVNRRRIEDLRAALIGRGVVK
ncbi:hypothetical protein MNBD_GAMMA26-651 [hydrothermal vent metagenome]|uniref:DUF1499 domain-containing protein n=1 Tax=hydrothermal vent metagenome TaxID=652676 RepID=A0A3B1AJF1_9ZZZZ